mgnify:CR=1 FL=1
MSKQTHQELNAQDQKAQNVEGCHMVNDLGVNVGRFTLRLPLNFYSALQIS